MHNEIDLIRLLNIEHVTLVYKRNATIPMASRIILGLSGPGFTGNIACQEIIRQWNMDLIGYVKSPFMPPQTSFFNGIISYPFRIYGSHEQATLVMICECPLLEFSQYFITKGLYQHFMKKSIKELILLDGYVSKYNKNTAVIATTPETWKRNHKLALTSHNRANRSSGYIGCFCAAFLNESIIHDTMDVFAMIAGTSNIGHPSFSGAIALLECLGRYLDFPFDFTTLMHENDTLHHQLQELINNSNDFLVDNIYKGEEDEYYI